MDILVIGVSEFSPSKKDNESHNWQGKVFLWQEQALFLGSAADTSFHASPAFKIVIALDGAFLLKTSKNGKWKNYKSAIIAPGQFHSINGQNNKLALIVLVPEAKAAQPLIPIVSRKGISRIPLGIIQNFLPIFSDFEKTSVEKVESEKICQKMLKKIRNGEELLSAAIDKRVSHGIERLRKDSEDSISVSKIAAAVELSESRFSHLFTEQVGVSMRRYQLWLRLREAIHLLAGGGSLTDTAHEAGFSDSAHLTRTFRQMLGIAPSSLLKNSSLIVFPE